MPDELRAFLSSLGWKAAEEVWLYLDSDAGAIEEMIDIVATTVTKQSQKDGEERVLKETLTEHGFTKDQSGTPS